MVYTRQNRTGVKWTAGARLLELLPELVVAKHDVHALLHALALPQPALLHLLWRLALRAQAGCPERRRAPGAACRRHAQSQPQEHGKVLVKGYLPCRHWPSTVAAAATQ